MDRPVAALITEDLSGKEPPSEFRVFKAGRNDTLEGPYFFTEKSAASVMAARADWGADCMVDLEHLSTIAKESPKYDPDPRAWCGLEVRNGELWAINVQWLQDGVERLAAKKQKYISPTFYFNETGEIEALFNMALVAMPKTKQAIALAGASFKGTKKMDIAQLASVAKALGVTTVEELMSALNGLVGMGSGEKKPEKEEAPPTPAPEPAKAAAGEPPPAPVVDEKKLAQNSAVFAENHALKMQVAALGAKLSSLESNERRGYVGELVKLGAETPATAWQDAEGSVPCARLQSESLDSLKTRVTQLSALPGRGTSVRAPVADAAGLSESELRICKDTGCSPEKYAEMKAARGGA